MATVEWDAVETTEPEEYAETEPHEERRIDGFVWTTQRRPDEIPVVQRSPSLGRARFLYRV